MLRTFERNPWLQNGIKAYVRGGARAGGEGGEGGLISSSRGTKQILTFARVKNVTLAPFCKTECFDYILAS